MEKEGIMKGQNKRDKSDEGNSYLSYLSKTTQQHNKTNIPILLTSISPFFLFLRFFQTQPFFHRAPPKQEDNKCWKYNQCESSFPLKQGEESRLKPTFCPDLLEAPVLPGLTAPAANLGVYEIAAFAIHAKALREKHSAFLSFVLGVDLLVLSQLVRAMGKFTLLLIGTETEFNEFFTELGFLLILLYGRFAGHRLQVVAGRGGVLGRWGIARALLLERLQTAGNGKLESPAGVHANLICKLFQ